jgi:hypothetical protein
LVFLRHRLLAIVVFLLTICMAIITWSSYQTAIAQYRTIQEAGINQSHDGTVIDIAALALLVTRTATPLPPTFTPTPIPPTATNTPTPLVTNTPTSTPEITEWSGAAFLMIEEEIDDLDILIKQPDQASIRVTRAFLEAFAAWELSRVFTNPTLTLLQPNDHLQNPKYTSEQTKADTWITDQNRRSYNNFRTVPGYNLTIFQQQIRITSDRYRRTPRSYFSNGFELPLTARKAVQTYADYLEQYLIQNNGILEDVVLFRLDDSFTMQTNPSGHHMTLLEPSDLDLKKGILLRIVHPVDPNLRLIFSRQDGFRYSIEDQTLIIEIHTDTRSADDLSGLVHLAFEILGRSGNAVSFNRNSAIYVIVPSTGNFFGKYGPIGRPILDSGFLYTKPFPELEEKD